LLSGADRPQTAALLTGGQSDTPTALTTDLSALRQRATEVPLTYQPVSLPALLEKACGILNAPSRPQRWIYLFSDLQRGSWPLAEGFRAEGLCVAVVDVGFAPVENVGITQLEVVGRPVLGETLVLQAMLLNASPQPRVVTATLRSNRADSATVIRRTLGPAGSGEEEAKIIFPLLAQEVGLWEGEVSLDPPDELSQDNLRRFALEIRPPLQARVIGEGEEVRWLSWALQPFEQADFPWPIAVRSAALNTLEAQELSSVEALFFCDVPRFDPLIAAEVAAFVRSGGTAIFLPGSRCDWEQCNTLFGPESEWPLLPAEFDAPVQEPMEAFANQRHPWLSGLYEQESDWPTIRLLQYYPLIPVSSSAETLLRSEQGSPLAMTGRYGEGRVVVFGFSPDTSWSNFPASDLFLPMMAKIALANVTDRPRSSYLAGSSVPIYLPPAASGEVAVTLPGGSVVMVPLRSTSQGPAATFTQTPMPGLYSWTLRSDPNLSGAFAVNAAGEESDLVSIPAETVKQWLIAAGAERVYVDTRLSGVQEQIQRDIRGRNWWDVLLACAIVLFLLEAILANRISARTE
jgi:hypothetical protein